MAANGRIRMGAWVSGSGIWPADRTLAPMQHYDRSLHESVSSHVAQSNASTTTTNCGVVGERLGCVAGGEPRAWLGANSTRGRVRQQVKSSQVLRAR